jgi:hypothetical protein
MKRLESIKSSLRRSEEKRQGFFKKNARRQGCWYSTCHTTVVIKESLRSLDQPTPYGSNIQKRKSQFVHKNGTVFDPICVIIDQPAQSFAMHIYEKHLS